MPKQEKDLNEIAKIEKAIASKYGAETVQNIKAGWSDEKEKKYIEQVKALYQKEVLSEQKEEKEEYRGFLISRKLFNEDDSRVCPMCDKYSFKSKDDLYLRKFGTCYLCFIEHVEGEGRKER